MASRLFLVLVFTIVAAVHAKHDWKRTYEFLKERRNVRDAISKRQPRTSVGARLVGGENQYEGRLEIYKYPHDWSTVCDDLFGNTEAQVACNMLGFTGGEFLWLGFGSGNGTIGLDNVQCSGDERNLWDCEHNEWGDNDCSHNEDVGIRCDAGEQLPGTIPPAPTTPDTSGSEEIRLVDGTNPLEGRVEVYHDGEWGTVCDDWWEDVDASVVCRQLGHAGGAAMDNAHFGSGEGPILLDNVECNGEEASLFDCEHRGWGQNDCGHHEDAGVICEENTDDSSDSSEEDSTSIRLVGGDSPIEGRVEVFHAGEWGTVCDDGWDDVDATVVCQSLGYDSGVALVDNDFGGGSGTILMDEVECSGSESSLEECDRSPWGEHDCYHFEDAGVRCS